MPMLHNECNNCGAVFKLKHDMDPEYYTVQACPFCGESIDADQQDSLEDDAE